MKTSNKILLSTFLIVLFILVGVHVALYAKYKKGEFSLVSDDMWPSNMVTYSLNDVKYVSVENMENITIQAGESSKLQYEKVEEDEENKLAITRRADTLFLSGSSNHTSNNRWYKRTSISLAGLLPLKIRNSQVHLSGSKGNGPASLDISLDDSFLDVTHNQNNQSLFNSLKIDAANKSRIDISNVNIKFLTVKLKDSFLEETSLNADSISIFTDGASQLQLTGKNLIKAKLTTYE